MSFGKSLVVVTGASRGIGREIVVQLSKEVADGSVFLLTARNQDALQELSLSLMTRNLTVELLSFDLRDLDDNTQDRLKQTLEEAKESGPFEDLFLIHNAGSVGDVSRSCLEVTDKNDWHQYLDVNLISMIQLNSIVLAAVDQEVAKKRTVVNITSLVAIQGFPSLGQYSVGKAARESFFRVLASETPSLRILSYSPGPVDTDMHDEVATNSFAQGIRDAFARDAPSTDVNRVLLTCSQTVEKLVGLLKKDDFESGSRIDYFDV